MKIFILILMVLSLTACVTNRSTLELNNVIDTISNYHDKTISVKGYLKISETHASTLSLMPRSSQFLDLGLQLEILPRDLYIPDTYYCVIIIGELIEYTENLILLGSNSIYGRVDVKNIRHCEN